MANEIVGFGSLDSIELEFINWNELYSTQYYSLLDSSKFISLQFQFNWIQIIFHSIEYKLVEFNWTQMKPNLMQIGFNWIFKIILLNWIQQNYENYEKVGVNLLFF
jgi:hypothetical protein